ncbi:MAG TPA: dTDP-4-dehydrorhamnose 3,5-epimerase [Acidobacteriaceae bacterium]|nr:dTDP-4-dehydrorhamnose 3,5-epimerase [Acidobacteriaceae bacterium]
MNIQPTALSGVLHIIPKKFSDPRGSFWETYNERILCEAGLPEDWKQDNTSVSLKNVVRGIHYQITQPQGKLVRVTYGAVYDVAVDLRRSSPTFGKHVGFELSEDNGAMLWIPPGFGHAFAALSERAGFAYKVTDYYSSSGERTILWNDPDLAIAWPVTGKDAIVSAKDQQGSRFREAEVFA